MDFATTVNTTTLESIDQWLATLAPDATAGITRDVGGCLVRQYLASRGYRRVVVCLGAGALTYARMGDDDAAVGLPDAVGLLVRRFDDLNLQGTGRGVHIDARTCRRLIRELQATPEALPTAPEEVPA